MGIAFSLGLGSLLGSAAGYTLGPYIFRPIIKPVLYDFLPLEADKKTEIDVPPLGTPIPDSVRQLLAFTEPWTVWPDFQRVSMLNRIIKGMWPSICRAGLAQALQQTKPMLMSMVLDKYPFVEDILMAGVSIRTNEDFVASAINFDNFTPGPVPLRLGGMKPYFTGEDEVIMEVPIVWGSKCRFEVTAVLRFGPLRVRVPVVISNLQIKVESRVTLKPLTDVIPCVGGVNLVLMEIPALDFCLELFGGCDLMALPIVKNVIQLGLKGVLNGMVVYPNSLTVPLMENFGVLPPATGALQVKLKRVEELPKGLHIQCELMVRHGRALLSRQQKMRLGSGKKTAALFADEESNLVVDSFESQTFKVAVWHVDRQGSQVSKLAVAHLPFGKMVQETGTDTEGNNIVKNVFQVDPFIKDFPNTEREMTLVLYIPKSPKHMLSAIGAVAGDIARLAPLGKRRTKSSRYNDEDVFTSPEELLCRKVLGSVTIIVKWMPFLQSIVAEADPAAPDPAPTTIPEAATRTDAERPTSSRPSRALKPSTRAINTNITSSLKGVLTVNLVRCRNLDVGSGNNPNFYVRMKVVDSVNDVEQVHRSSTIINEDSPRWGSLFDFVMVSAHAEMYIYVHRVRMGVRTTVLRNVSKLNVLADEKKDEDVDKVVGKLQLALRDVAANGSIKDVWPLNDAEMGEIELALKWQTVSL